LFAKDGVISKKLARALGSAMWMYDLTGGARIGKLHKRLSTDEALAHMPTLPRELLAGSYLYYDARADDARLTLTIARTAAVDHGAVVINDATVSEIRKDESGRASGLTVQVDGHTIAVEADSVVNATGVWADEVRTLDEGTNPETIRPAKGIHITVPWELVRNDIAVVIPVPKDKRSVFVVPWGAFTYIGTTDTDYEGSIDDPQCTPDDIAYLLGAINRSVTGTITEDDIVGTWAGLRPLVRDASSGRTADLSRRHRVAASDSGMVTITGGKLTTYREMAADTVDTIVEILSRRGDDRRVGRSRTKRLRLRGAEGYQAFVDSPPPTALDAATMAHLADRYGGEARTLVAMVELRSDLGNPLVSGLPYIRAEAVYAARYEMARSVDDVLSRRTRARLLGRDASVAAAADVAELMRHELAWDDDECARQADSYREAVEHERAAAALGDRAADTLLGA
jgi:glycerol-3-phosphate dehydrogenase